MRPKMHPFYENSPKASFLEDILYHHLLLFCLTIFIPASTPCWLQIRSWLFSSSRTKSISRFRICTKACTMCLECWLHSGLFDTISLCLRIWAHYVLLFLHDPIDHWNHPIFSLFRHRAVFLSFHQMLCRIYPIGALLVPVFTPESEFRAAFSTWAHRPLKSPYFLFILASSSMFVISPNVM